jgi:hypothetical protein
MSLVLINRSLSFFMLLQRKEFAQKVNAHAVQQLGEILPVLQPVQRQKARAITEVRVSIVYCAMLTVCSGGEEVQRFPCHACCSC